MAVYASDFQGGGVFEPVDPPVFLGLEPLFFALLVAIGAILVLLGWHLRGGRTRPASDGAEAIWKAIDDALKAAMKADGGSLTGKAEDVERVIRTKLGATLALGRGLLPGLEALAAALAGRPHTPRPLTDPDEGTDRPGEDPPDEPASDESSSTSATVTQITVINGHPDRGGSGHGNGGHTPGGGHDRSLSRRERDHAIRAAIADLNDWWSRKDERIQTLRAAHSELSAD